ncbi:MAG: MarR family transcriptional regulator [Firmicutes bacterium]|nr:MarR family transcriptional regulator [Bacillota bacterium]
MDNDLRLIWLFVRTFEERQKTAGGLTPVQFAAVRFLALHDGPNLSAVAEALGVSNAAATKLVDRLVGRKIVARLEGPIDRRERRLVLSQRGQEVLAAETKAGVGRIEEALARMKEEDRAALRRGIEAFLQVALQDVELVKRVWLKCGYEHVADCLGEQIYRRLGGGPRQV